MPASGGRVAGSGKDLAGGKNPAGRRCPIIAHADVKRMLLAQKASPRARLALVLYSARLVDEDRVGGDAESAALLGLLTPVAKSWPSEFGLAANDLAIPDPWRLRLYPRLRRRADLSRQPPQPDP